ncbi:hypothetical protein GPROT2_00030 [Gammaproteobacteria bacterium]|nr:hypothetical protein GPROT2_00030 [Gammaproteobacteria bacterium]
MRGRSHPGRALATVLLACWLASATAAGSDGPLSPQILVTATREPVAGIDLLGNTARIDAGRIGLVGATHPVELGMQAAGTWLERGSGQESLPAIRSPVLTGPGSCGAFLMLEDGIPVRPAGFCNVNELFEILTEQAIAMEVVRGPAKAAYGANGLHGTLNFLLPAPGGPAGFSGSLEAGPYDYWRGIGQWRGPLGDDAAVAGLLLNHDGDFRDDAGYDQAKGFFRLAHDSAAGTLEAGFAGTVLDQETAGYIVGQDAYKDETLRRQNLNPEAYRKADSERLDLRFTPAAGQPLAGTDLRAWLHRSGMDFLQHFLPGKPREENGQWSTGLMATRHVPLGGGRALTSGVDLELARGYLKETQAGDSGIGSLPAGRHYDYDATSYLAGGFAQLRLPLGTGWFAEAGLRAELMRYDYDNHMIDGNTRDDGTPCTPGPCRYSRPADRQDDFFNLAPNAGLLWHITPGLSAYASLARGFRPPQAAELYRLQSQQVRADLESETLDSAELGLHWLSATTRIEAVGYTMKKRHVIFQDASRFNVGDGRTRHRGLELQAQRQWSSGLYAGLAGSYSRQTYAFDAVTPGGEPIRSGEDIDTAPRTLGSAHLGFARGRATAELEWVHIGSYSLDVGNTTRYDGHDLLNLRGSWRLSADWALTARIDNLADRLYAERADYVAFPAPTYRYFPGRERELYLEIAWRTP